MRLTQMSLLDLADMSAATASTCDMSREVLDDRSQRAPAARDASPLQARRPSCAWCGKPIPDHKRSDSKTCGKPCRQALSRFRIGRADAALADDRPLGFAYADPPYPGLAGRYYKCPEVDHRELVARLVEEFPDGWALSTSAAALQSVLALCPAGVRVCPWIRGTRPSKSRRVKAAWEPLLLFGGRPPALTAELVDVLLWGGAGAPGRQHSHPGALIGMKPAAFAEWLFRLLGARIGDTLVDLFPGSGAITRAWQLYTSPTPAPRAASRLAGATRRLQELRPALLLRRNRPAGEHARSTSGQEEESRAELLEPRHTEASSTAAGAPA